MVNKVYVFDWYKVAVEFKGLSNSFPFIVLLVLILIDVLTGKYKALKLGILDSSIGTSGMIKHTTIIILTVVVTIISRLMQMQEVALIFETFYIFEYITSVLENLDSLGIPFPDSFKKYFNRMRTENENERIGKDDV